MKNITFPLNFKFNISTFANDFVATDASGSTVAYVKQKMFKLKEDILIYDNENKTEVNYRINADRWIDFSAAYSMKDKKGTELGKIARKGWRSIWKAEYELIDQNQKLQYHIREDNAWIKVFDSMFGEIPILGLFTGYFFNPSYSVLDLNKKPIVKLKKEGSFFGRKFSVSKLETIDADDEYRIVLGLMMMVLLERRKG
ncbi:MULTISPECIES: hypothetical protein [unclassified Algibacter]|uniref:hypothetical protein n=1 Tax=unclassified Algibacter TaxID=2615009 RepID=UPI00131C9941|nr:MULTISPECIES: hypothetical protein [unclassified Algibacter]MCL5128721.1 hypothetical protein [Algibacter sp. L4_22]